MQTQRNSNEVLIVAAKRTPIGSFQGQFAHLKAPELAAKVILDIFHDKAIQALIEHPGIDECLIGCVLNAGIGQAPARQALLNAHLPESIPCSTINKVCGSGMKAVTLGVDSILAGQAKVVIAGGMESMSQAPFLIPRTENRQIGHRKLLDHLSYDGLENYYDGLLMGHFAELLAARDTEKFSRQAQDLYTMAAVEKAKFATRMGYLKAEIVAIEGCEEDEQVPKSHLDKVAKLAPVFHTDGTITAASAASISDGAAILLLVEKGLAESKQLAAKAFIKGYSQYATRPDQYTIAPLNAIKALLQQLSWNIHDVDLFEINEAFAVIAMFCIAELQIPANKVNIHGGACALGHPIGASGSRILVSLLNALQIEQGKRGIAVICIGGGEAMAIAVEML